MKLTTDSTIKQIEILHQININLQAYIEEFKMRETMLEYRAKTYKKLFNTHPDSIVLLRLSDGRILESNKRFENLLGYSKDDINTIGLKFFIADDINRIKNIARNAARNEKFFKIECTLPSQHNGFVSVFITASVIKHDEQTLVQVNMRTIH